MSKTIEQQKNLEKMFGKEIANLIEDDHILSNWVTHEGITGVSFDTTDKNRWKLYNLLATNSMMIEKLKKHILKISSSNDATIEEAWEGVLTIMEKIK